MSDQILKQLKIKIASVRRIRKELAFYEDDLIKEQARFDGLKASGIDPHDLHQAVDPFVFHLLFQRVFNEFRKTCCRRLKL